MKSPLVSGFLKLLPCLIVCLALALMLAALPALAASSCPATIEDRFVDSSLGLRLPVEKILKQSASSIVGAWSFDFSNGQIINNQYVADVSLSLITDLNECPAIRRPLGLLYRHALVDLKVPTEVKLSASGGIANVGFDGERLAATLAAAVPLPVGFYYVAHPTAIPADTIDGTTLSIDVVGPGPLGTLFTIDWRLDKKQPDLGLRDAFNPILDVAAQTALANSREAALMVIRRVIQEKTEKYLSSEHLDFGAITIAGMRIDWGQWDRGDQVFKASVAWPGSDSSLRSVFPNSAEVRFNPSGDPDFSLPPIDTENLRSILAKQVAALLPDQSILAKIAARFGDVPPQGIPAGWLRVRNADLSATQFSADIAFLIDETADEVNWHRVTFNLPAPTDGFKSVIKIIADAADGAITTYLAQSAQGAAYAAALTYIDDHKTESFSLFGVPFLIKISSGSCSALPPKPIVTLHNDTLGVTITGVGLTVMNGQPAFDWSTAHIDGADKLAERLAQVSGLEDNDLSLSIGNLSFSNDRLSGQLIGNLLGNDFFANFTIGENDSKISLPSMRTALINGIQSAVSGKELTFSGLTLSDVRVCPDGPTSGTCTGDDLSLSARFAVSGILSGILELKIYKKLSLAIKSIDSSSGFLGLADLFSTGVVSFNLPPKSFSPLVLSGTITVPPIYDVITIPPIPFEWSSASHKVTLSYPTFIPIDTDILIPPWIDLSQVIVPIAKNQDGSITIGARITLGEHYVQYVFNIDGTMTGNLSNRSVKVVGKASLVMLDLYDVNGKIDFALKEMHTVAETSGLLRAILPQQSKMDVFGAKCLVMQRDHINFLFFSIDDNLIIQIPAGACGHPISSEAASCGLTSDGGVCIGGNVTAGSIATGTAHLKAGLDLKFGIDADVSTEILTIIVHVHFQGDQNMLQVKASVPKFGAQFGFAIAKPTKTSDADIDHILGDLIKGLRNLSIKFPAKITGSDGHGNSVTVDVSKVDAAGPSTPEVERAPLSSAVAPAQGKSTAQGPGKDELAPPLNKPLPPAAVARIEVDSTPSDSHPLEEGPLKIIFDGSNHIIQFNTHDKLPPQTSTEAVRADAVKILKSGCPTLLWMTSGGAIVDPVNADAVILAIAGASCDSPPPCVSGELCAVALRTATKTLAAAVRPNAPWLSVQDIVQGKHRTNYMEKTLVAQTARAHIFGVEAPVDGLWTCIEMKDGGCGFAIETNTPGGGRAYISGAGDFVEMANQSFLYAETGQDHDDEAKRLRTALFLSAGRESLRVYGKSGSAWMIEADGASLPANAGVLEQNSQFVPVMFRAGTIESTFSPSEPLPDEADPIVGKITGLIVDNPTSLNKHWSIDDLGITTDGRRIIIRSEAKVFLVTSDPGPSKQRNLADLQSKSCLPAPAGTDIDTWLHKVFTAPRSEWSEINKASGRQSLTNPAIMIFASDCGQN